MDAGMIIKSALSLCLASLFLAGCTLVPLQYTRGQGTEQQFKQDLYQCEIDARRTPGGICLQMDLFEKCMDSRGHSPIPGSGSKGTC